MSEKLSLVRFRESGMFGIRKRCPTGDVFLDMNNKDYWWTDNHSLFKHCRGEEVLVRDTLNSLRRLELEASEREKKRELDKLYQVVVDE